MTETVLTDKGKLKIAQAVHYGNLGVMEAITLTEIAVLQSPEVVAMREASTQDAINYAKSFDRGHVAGWDSALEAAIDIVAIHGGSVEIEAAIRAIKSPEADMEAKP